MQLPKSFTTVTPLSKTLAFMLLITLPFAGFYLGMQYQQQIDQDTVLLAQTQVKSISKLPSPTITPNKVADLNQNQTAIKSLVNNFYTALTNQDGKTLFSYITSPSTADEKANYTWLTGADLGMDQFYRVFLRLKILNPQVVSIQKVDSTTYLVTVKDLLQAYSNADPIGWDKPESRSKISLTVVNANGKWLVDKFTDQTNTAGGGSAGTPKYSGFGQ